MRLAFITSFLFLITTSSFAQQKGLEVVYKEKMLKNPIDTTDSKTSGYKKMMHRQMEKVKHILGDVSYTLQATQKEAIFQYEDFLENDNNANKMDAIMASSADGLFYTNIQNYSTVWQKEGAHGNYVRIKESDKLRNWQIKSEKKVINGYKCYKATQKILLNNKLEILIEAWFAPDIPYSFGPKGYGGLPGLIIALNERGFYFYASEIKTTSQTNKINKPTKGKLLSWKEYQEILDGSRAR